MPCSDIVVDHHKITVCGSVFCRIFINAVRHIRSLPLRIYNVRIGNCIFDILNRLVTQSVQLISHAPGNNRWMMSVIFHHFCDLLFKNTQLLFSGLFRFFSPERNFFLYQHSMPVAPVKYPVVLLPVEPGKHTVGSFQAAQHLFQLLL